jgi:hypothetical protein
MMSYIAQRDSRHQGGIGKAKFRGMKNMAAVLTYFPHFVTYEVLDEQ